MGSFCLYVIPSVAVTSPRELAQQTASLLIEQHIVSSNPNAEDEFALGHVSFYEGRNCQVAFANEQNPIGPMFEACYLYGDNRFEIVPQFPAVNPKCGKCGQDVSEEYYEFINSGLTLELFKCPGCHQTFRVDQLVDEVGIFLSQFYLCFDDTDGAQLKSEWLSNFSREIGISFQVKEYWYT